MSDVRTTPCVRGSPRAGVPTADPSPHRHDTRIAAGPDVLRGARRARHQTGHHGKAKRPPEPVMVLVGGLSRVLSALENGSQDRFVGLCGGRRVCCRGERAQGDHRQKSCGHDRGGAANPAHLFSLTLLRRRVCIQRGMTDKCDGHFGPVLIGLLPNTRTQATAPRPARRREGAQTSSASQRSVDFRPAALGAPRRVLGRRSRSARRPRRRRVVAGGTRVDPVRSRLAVPGGRGDQHRVTVARQG